MRLYTKVVPEPSEVQDLPSPDPVTPPHTERHSLRRRHTPGTPQAQSPAAASPLTPGGTPALDASAPETRGTGASAESNGGRLEPTPQSLSPPWSGRGQKDPGGFRGSLRSRWPLVLPFEEPEDVNKNTSWFSSPGVWSAYVLIVFLVWMLLQAALGCSGATAWVAVNALHFVV